MFTNTKSDRTHRSIRYKESRDWLSAEDMARILHTSSHRIRETLSDKGYGCKVSMKPTKEAFRKNLVKKHRSNGKTIYKWSKHKVFREIVDEFQKVW